MIRLEPRLAEFEGRIGRTRWPLDSWLVVLVKIRASHYLEPHVPEVKLPRTGAKARLGGGAADWGPGCWGERSPRDVLCGAGVVGHSAGEESGPAPFPAFGHKEAKSIGVSGWCSVIWDVPFSVP